MSTALRLTPVVALLVGCSLMPLRAAEGNPYRDGRFQGRIAYSADGNHNDPDDWIASPVTLAILAEAGLKDRLVHFDYNSILPLTDPEWERTHSESVLGAAERYGFTNSVFYDCRKDLDAAIASIAQAINASSADNPLYFIIAGPMEVPSLGIRKSDPAKRQFVYCLSHSRWNDGFASGYKFTVTKRSVIEQDVHWVQIADQNRLLSFGRYGTPAPPEEFEPYFWMRDSRDAKVHWLWERMLVSTRPDPSDAGMTWFLVSGDEECDPAKLKSLLEDHRFPTPVMARRRVRIEAENFRHFEGFALEDRNDRQASHRLNVRLDGGSAGRIRTRFDEPFVAAGTNSDLEIRYLDERGQRCRFGVFVNGVPQGTTWESTGEGSGWTSRTLHAVTIRPGDEIRLDAEGAGARLDFVQLTSLRASWNVTRHERLEEMNSKRAPMTRARVWFAAVSGIVCALAAGLGADSRAPSADSPKGKWGRVTPIEDRNHPNLYYDRGEIEELRQMMLVQHSPQHLYDRYQAEIRDAVAVKTIPDNKSPHPTNMKAALSYAIEPTPVKADAIRVSLLSFMSAFPNGLPGWYSTPGCYFSGYSVPWMFDLLLAYHPDKLSPSEKTALKAWFLKSAQNLRFDTRSPGAPSQSGREVVPPVTREGKTMVSFPNWFSRYMGPSVACALVSGDQVAVDYWADSGWPHELLTFAGVTGTHPTDAANRYDLVMYLLAVYPSGANTDTYTREGYRLPDSDWYTTDYTSGGYHFAQMSGAVLGAEMAYHNGMTGVFTVTDRGTEPALLRHWKRAIQSRTEIDRRPGNTSGHPVIGFSQELWAGYRRYADPTIEGAVSSLTDAKTDELELPSAVWEFFGYPRRIVWPAKGRQP